MVAGGLYLKEAYDESQSGEQDNDAAVAIGGLRLQLVDLGGKENRFLIDARTESDFFGQVDKENLQLTQSSTFTLKTVVYQRPPSGKGLFYSLGRFPVRDAGVFANDGGLVGSKITRRLAISAFAGQFPSDIASRYRTPASPLTQVGATVAYQKSSSDWKSFTNISNSVVQAPNRDPFAEDSRNYLFHSSALQFDLNNRLTNILYYDFAPEAKLSYWVGNFYHRFNRNLIGNVGIINYDTSNYLLVNEQQNGLDASSYQAYRADISNNFTKTFKLQLNYRNGTRAADNLKDDLVGVKMFFSRLPTRKFLLTVGGGQRNNFVYKSTFVGSGLHYFSQVYEVSLEYERDQRAYDDQNKNANIARGSVHYYLSEKLHGSLTFQGVSGDDIDLNYAMFTIGYRIGNQEFSPIRNKAPVRENVN